MIDSIFETELSKKVAQKIGRAISDFSMIREGDRILVGTSGGKDSNLLMYALRRLKSISPVRFGLVAAVIDPTESCDLAMLSDYARSLTIDLEIVRHPIFEILDSSPDKPACSLCANLRRGILASAAKRLGCNVLALGHHRDDAVETVFMNLIYSGRFACFHPHLYMSRSGMRVIRPMVYLPEREIVSEAKRLGLPLIDFGCRHAGSSSRALMKAKVGELSLVAKDAPGNVIHALRKGRAPGTWGQMCEMGDANGDEEIQAYKEANDDFR